eukprot:GGOE01062413.1.p2 GENE.GGOE01062413.1~~GGOE01062413.1.p2  ORF type:complete len:295 (+),score=96.78 GGOE01062413.1:979-1863(+)
MPTYQRICASFVESMAMVYKVRPTQLANTILFHGWDVPTLEQVVAKLQPTLFPEDSIILEAGSPGTAVFIVAKGRCRIVRGAASGTVELTAGALLGLRGCMFVEPHPHEVRAATTVQAWRLPKATLMDFMLLRPDRFLEAKRRLNEELAQTLLKPPLEALFADSPIAAAPRSVQQQLYSLLQPVVFAAHDPVVGKGDLADHLLFVAGGRCVAGGAVLPCSTTRCLGADLLSKHAPCWRQTISAQERVEGWRLPLAELLVLADTPPCTAQHCAQQTLLMDITQTLAAQRLHLSLC